MATRIRLARGGRKKRPFYRIVVADGRAPRDGRFIERIGSYDPLLTENKVSLDVERAKHWLNVGAQPSHRVSKLLALQGVEHKLVVLPPPTPDDVKAEHAKAKAAKKAGAQPVADKAAEQPKAEAKPAEEPKAEQPKAEAEPAEAPKPEQPKAEAKPAEDTPAEEAKPADAEPKAEAKAAEEKPAEGEAAAEEEPAS